MKIDHSRFDPTSGFTFVVASGLGVKEAFVPSSLLRCGAFRFRVEQFLQSYPECAVPTVSALVSGVDPPQEGMVVHPADEPLTDEELAAALQHLLMLPRLLRGIDVAGVSERLASLAASPNVMANHAALLQALADLVEGTIAGLPPLACFAEAERYKIDILRAC